jgi:hypothetical protein
VDEADFTQSPQMPRGGRLKQPELRAHQLDELAGGYFTAGETLHDAATSRISQDSECMHVRTI